MKQSVFLSLVVVAALPIFGQTTQKTYAQKLVEEAMASHPDVLILAMHVKSPTDPNYPIIAWGGPTGGKVRMGKKADEDDMRVVKTGKENLEIGPTGDRYEVELPLLDKSGKTLGALGVVYNYKPGDDKGELKKKAEQLRAELRDQIPAASKLFGPAQ